VFFNFPVFFFVTYRDPNEKKEKRDNLSLLDEGIYRGQQGKRQRGEGFIIKHIKT